MNYMENMTSMYIWGYMYMNAIRLETCISNDIENNRKVTLFAQCMQTNFSNWYIIIVITLQQ